MTKSRWTNVAYWRKRFANDRSMNPPDEGNNIGTESVFGWVIYNSSQNSPCSVNAAYWIWCPNAYAMAGYLRFCYAVGCLDELLDVASWQETEGVYRSVEDILEEVPREVLEDTGCDPKALLSAMRDLDKALRERSAEECFKRSRRAIRRFLGGINKSTWLGNDLSVFNTSAAVGRHILAELKAEEADLDEVLHMSKTEWRRFCGEAARDRRSGEAFGKVLKGFEEA